MPKKPIDYSNTSFYRIVCKDTNIKDCYVGHTTNLKERIRCHRKSCNNPNDTKHNYKVYRFIRSMGGWDNWSLILIETKSCDNKYEATKEEFNFYNIYISTLNTQTPTQTKKEWNENIYNEKRRKKYNENIEEKNKILIQNKKYVLNNEKKIKEYKQKNYQQNKEKLLENYNCGCGGKYQKCTEARHFRTKIHLAYLEGLKTTKTETENI